jgi:acyl transferase domain-containing protein
MSTEPIAIVGIGCRFPGASGPEAFWRLLRDGKDAVRDVPASRWDADAFYDPDPSRPGKMNTRRGGFLEDVDRFDPQFFGISPREVRGMDPQQRLLLEVAWEALEDAGQPPEGLAGTATGVFMGVSSFDYYELLTKDPAAFDAYTGTGNLSAVKANRLSYFFDLKGPSMAIDTACSSSLVAVHLACQSLWSGESTLALVGGVHLLLSPGMCVGYAKGGFMAEDGRCKTFDARADGYVRGEGAGVVVLKKLSLAEAHDDRLYAVVLGSAVNQDGASNGITAPNPLAQEAVLEAAYRRAGVSPGLVRYVEAHGTGTKLGDPIEMKALAAVMARGRPAGETCAVGSVKTNIGHLEAGAGIAGLIKVALSLAHRQIPPSLHFETPNPYIPFDEIPLRVQRTLGAWPRGTSPSVAGVSSFGFGGTNAHVVLAEAPEPRPAPRDAGERPSHLLCLSARSPEALSELTARYATHLRDQPDLRVGDLCHTAALGRTHFKSRLAVVGASTSALRQLLEAAAAGRETPEAMRGEVSGRRRPRVAFVFAGQASPLVHLRRLLYASEPAFRGALDRCAAILGSWPDAPRLPALLGDDLPAGAPVDDPTLFSLEYGLAALWASWGVTADAAMGQGVGEYGAACAAGALGLEDGLRLAVARGRLVRENPRALSAAESALGELAAAAAAVACARPRVPLVSNATGRIVEGEPPRGDEWLISLEGPVRLERGREALRGRGLDVFLEIRPGTWADLLASLGQLYVKGVPVDWVAFEGGRGHRKVALPSYPFQRERHWPDAPREP